MVPQGQSVDHRRFGRKGAMALCVLAAMPLARAGNNALERPINTAAPLEIPHSLNLVLADMARKRNRRPGNIENHSFLDLTPGLTPVDMAAQQRHTRASRDARDQAHAGGRLDCRKPVSQQERKRLVSRGRSGRTRIRRVLPLPSEALGSGQENGDIPIYLKK